MINYLWLEGTYKGICPFKKPLKNQATILWGNNKSQVWGLNCDNSTLEGKEFLSPLLDFLTLHEHISATSNVHNPSLAKQVMGASDCPKAETEEKKPEGNKLEWRSVSCEDDIIDNFLKCHWISWHSTNRLFWKTTGSLYLSSLLVSEPIMSGFEYDFFL